MKKLLIILPLLLFGCKSNNPVVCQLEQQVATAVTAAVGTVCTCANPDALNQATLADLGSLGVCPDGKAKVTSNLGQTLCGPVITLLLSKGCDQLPKAAACVANPDSAVLAKAIASCQSKLQ